MQRFLQWFASQHGRNYNQNRTVWSHLGLGAIGKTAKKEGIHMQCFPQYTPSEDVGDRGLPDCPPSVGSVVLGDREIAALLPSRIGASVTLIFGRAASDMA